MIDKTTIENVIIKLTKNKNVVYEPVTGKFIPKIVAMGKNGKIYYHKIYSCDAIGTIDILKILMNLKLVIDNEIKYTNT